MIEKLDELDSADERVTRERIIDIVRKINEVIDAINKLSNHHHETLDTHYNTSYPRYTDKMPET